MYKSLEDNCVRRRHFNAVFYFFIYFFNQRLTKLKGSLKHSLPIYSLKYLSSSLPLKSRTGAGLGLRKFSQCFLCLFNRLSRNWAKCNWIDRNRLIWELFFFSCYLKFSWINIVSSCSRKKTLNCTKSCCALLIQCAVVSLSSPCNAAIVYAVAVEAWIY